MGPDGEWLCPKIGKASLQRWHFSLNLMTSESKSWEENIEEPLRAHCSDQTRSQRSLAIVNRGGGEQRSDVVYYEGGGIGCVS